MILKVFDVTQGSCNFIKTDNMGTLPIFVACTGRSTFEDGGEFTSQATGERAEGHRGGTPAEAFWRRPLALTM